MSTSLISDLLNIQPQTSTPAGSMQVKMLPCEYIMRNPDNKIMSWATSTSSRKTSG